MTRWLAWAVLAALLVGCQGKVPAARPPAAPAGPEPASPPPPRPTQVAVVDLLRAAQVHPRWAEVAALDRQIREIQLELALIPEVRAPALQLTAPKIDLSPEMRAEVERIRPQFQREVDLLTDAGHKELEAYVAQVHADQQRQFDAKRAALAAELEQAIQDKQQALTQDTQQFQEQSMAEYRLPLLNLRLKLEAVQQTNKADSDALSAQMQALTKERDAKIAAHEKANQDALQEFQKAKTDQSNAELKAYGEQLAKDGQRMVDERAAQISARVHAQIQAKQAEFNQRLKERGEALVAAAREQATREMTQARTQAEEQARKQIQSQLQAQAAQVRTLRSRLQQLQQERAQVFGIILADLRVETAALAQEKGWDVVLTQAITTVGAVDATDDLIARLKR